MKRLLFLIAFAATAQNSKTTLTVDWIMRGPELYGHTPQSVRWSRDGSRVFFEWRAAATPLLAENDTYAVNRDGSALRKLSDEEAKQAPPTGGELSKDKSATVFVEGGDIYVYDHAAQMRKRVTRTGEAESGARFWQDARHITFQRGSNLYLLALDDASIEQLTDIQAPGAAPAAGPPAGGGFGGGRGAGVAAAASASSEQKGTDSQETVKKEERALLAVIEERAKKREEAEAKRKKENPRKPWTLPARHSVMTMMLSPDGKQVVAQVREAGDRDKTTIVPNFVTESAYTEDIPARDKVGDNQPLMKVALINRETGAQQWVEFSTKDRPVQLFAPQFSDEGKAVMRARAADNKDQWLLSLDLATGKVKELVKMHDDAWVGGPMSFNYGFLPENRVWFVSEQDGFAHVYSVSADGGTPKQLTSGKWEVRDVKLSDDKRVFYLTTAEASAAESQVYAMSIDGGDRRRLTKEPGGHEVTMSADGAMADVYGYTNRPPELYINGKQVTNSPAADFSKYPWSDPPIIDIPARDGVKVPARIYKPDNWKKGGPLVIFVHGAGYAQNAHKRWATYSREYMFHHLLRDRGYLVLDLDYRASAGYGRDWRTAIYRYMGGKDLDDQVDAVKWAIKEHGVDPKRVGLYGGSYGGFITLMALFTQPDVFQAGAALRPVTDWAHYNHPYTANILNLPQKDQEAYKRSSPIYHAAGLKGALLIAHGMVDVNVHYQDSVRLAQKLIELRKENWEFASYPVEDHGFVQPTSWADEYKRILKLFDTTIGVAPETVAAKGKK